MNQQTIVPPEFLTGPGGVELLDRLLPLLPRLTGPCFLVGGAVRDCLLRLLAGQRPAGAPVGSYDLDLLVPAGGVRLARRLADALGAAFYPLDPPRDVGRIVFRPHAESGPRVVDVASFQGATLWADLGGRDFTVNAMALEVTRQPLVLIDPLGGLDDLRAGRLRAASEGALLDDAVRTLRAVRLRAQFGFEIETRTLSLIRTAADRLSQVSAERVRDELVKILSLPDSAGSLRLMDSLGLLCVVLPELSLLKGLAQLPRNEDGFEHTLQVVGALERLLPLDGAADHPRLPFSDQVAQHVTGVAAGGHSRRLLLTLAAWLHDIGKPATFSQSADGTIHFLEHEAVGAGLARAALERLRFSRQAAHWVETIVRDHGRPLSLAREPSLSRRAIHRFFRDAGEAGVEVALLALANHLPIVAAAWSDANSGSVLETTTELLRAYFVGRDEVIAPPILLSGGEIVRRFGLPPGPAIGELLRELTEAQAAGEVATYAHAQEWVRTRLQISNTK